MSCDMHKTTAGVTPNDIFESRVQQIHDDRKLDGPKHRCSDAHETTAGVMPNEHSYFVSLKYIKPTMHMLSIRMFCDMHKTTAGVTPNDLLESRVQQARYDQKLDGPKHRCFDAHDTAAGVKPIEHSIFVSLLNTKCQAYNAQTIYKNVLRYAQNHSRRNSK